MGQATRFFAFVGILAFSEASAADYLVKFKPSVNGIAERNLLEGKGLATSRYFPELGIYVARSKGDVIDTRLLSELMHSSEVVYVEKDENIWKVESAPRDPFYGSQTELKNTHLERAWNTTTGSKDIVVAVVDTGVDMAHPDLKNQIWTNPKEILGNGRDDDGNGYVDDLHGWDFHAKDSDPKDENGHGTHVSGIIGAEANNGVGVAGVSWNVTIMPLRFLDKKGSGSTQNAIEAILYAVNNGARIINASWGAYSGSNALRDAIAYAAGRGVLLVSAAGNETNDTDAKAHFPSSYRLPNVMEIAAVDEKSRLASFSNWGWTTTSLAAPGVQILSSVPNGEWERLSGTSMATPVVSGIAALVLSKMPNLSAIDLRNALLNAAVSRPSLNQLTRTGGEIDAARAVEQLSDGFQVWPSKIVVRKGDKFQFSAFKSSGAVSWTSSSHDFASIDSLGELTTNAVGDLKVSAQDASGAVSEAAVKVVEVIPSKPSKPGVGCSALSEVDTRPYESRNAMLSFGAPLALAFILRRKKR